MRRHRCHGNLLREAAVVPRYAVSSLLGGNSMKKTIMNM